ncbi:hypothetical protein D3Z45_14345 [Lachnospiraceae bacterium]|nr:hypothetical protein [Lachnospiraceae bacterium]
MLKGKLCLQGSNGLYHGQAFGHKMYSGYIFAVWPHLYIDFRLKDRLAGTKRKIFKERREKDDEFGS